MKRADGPTAPTRLAPGVERHIALTQGVLWLERVWDASWPASGFLLLYLALSLFDVWGYVPALVHIAVLGATVAVTLLALVKAVRTLRPPTRADAIQRLEIASALTHRPLETASDKLSDGALDPATRALWQGAQREAADALIHLRQAAPRSRLSARDPQALRFAALLLFVLGAALAGPDGWSRIGAGLNPNFGAGSDHPVALDAWIDPPPYTGLPPVFLARGALPSGEDNVPSVPQGAVLTLRLHGDFSKARVELKPSGRNHVKSTSLRLARDKSGTLTGTLPLETTSEAILRAHGRVLGRWPINVVPDTPPQIAFDGEIKATSRAALRIPYTVSDDFGLKSVELQIRLADKSSGDTVTLPLAVPSNRTGNSKPARMRAYKDLSAHPWAGAKVVMTLVATDAKGQEGVSEPVTMMLPERHFTHPLARALVDARRRLALSDNGIGFASGFLGAATGPGAPPIPSASVYLAMRLAYWQLMRDPSHEAIASASELMWSAALALENGGADAAERDLQAAKDALSKALRDHASQEEISEKLQALRDAIDRYLGELSRQMAQMNPNDNAPLDPNLQLVTPQDFENMLQALENLAQTGANQEAEQLLGALDDILQNLQAPGQQREASPQDKARQQAMNELGAIIGDQRKLMDDTNRKGEDKGNDAPLSAAPLPDQDQNGHAPETQGDNGDQAANEMPQTGQGKTGEGHDGKGSHDDQTKGQQSPDGGAGTLAERQDGLRQRLDKMMQALGEGTGDVPAPLGRAERAMRDAHKDLRNGNQLGAIQNQKEALDALRDSAQSIAKAMDDANRQARAGSGRGGRASTDPFGRPIAGAPDVNSVLNMPDKGEVQRAREILNEIRRRAAERGRPQSELDYLDRLLERF